MTRIIVWTIVGIVVVLGVVFIVKARSGKVPQNVSITSDEAYTAFITRYEKRIEQLNASVEKAKGAIANPTPEIQQMITDLNTKMQDLTTTINEMKAKTTPADREAAVKKVRELSSDIRKSIRNLGGTVGADEEGGE